MKKRSGGYRRAGKAHRIAEGNGGSGKLRVRANFIGESVAKRVEFACLSNSLGFSLSRRKE